MRLAETERVLELVLRASATGVAISDPDTAVIHEVNDAFCDWLGRPRAELLGKPATDSTWYDPDVERSALLERMRRTGAIEQTLVRVKRPDGTMRAGETSATLISIAGRPLVLATIDDITQKRRIGLEHTGALIAYEALITLAAETLRGRPLIESVAAMLPALRRCGEFDCALLWDPTTASPTLVDGEVSWPDLARAVANARQSAVGEVRLLVPSSTGDGADIGFLQALPAIGQSVVLLSSRALPLSAQTLVSTVLSGLATIVSAARD